MLASTDALAITAVLRRAGGPEALVTLMEGESLLNDASGAAHARLCRLPAVHRSMLPTHCCNCTTHPKN